MTCWASQAADNHAAQEDAAEARAAFVERFAQDAADELLAEDSNAQYLLGKTDALEALLLAVLDADPQNAYSRIVAMRDGLRAARYRHYSPEVNKRARELDREIEREPDYENADRHRRHRPAPLGGRADANARDSGANRQIVGSYRHTNINDPSCGASVGSAFAFAPIAIARATMPSMRRAGGWRTRTVRRSCFTPIRR